MASISWRTRIWQHKQKKRTISLLWIFKISSNLSSDMNEIVQVGIFKQKIMINLSRKYCWSGGGRPNSNVILQTGQWSNQIYVSAEQNLWRWKEIKRPASYEQMGWGVSVGCSCLFHIPYPAPDILSETLGKRIWTHAKWTLVSWPVVPQMRRDNLFLAASVHSAGGGTSTVSVLTHELDRSTKTELTF